MSPPQRVGNALACGLMRCLWRMPVADLGPYRAIWREAFDALDVRDRSFGWTVEMQVRAHALGRHRCSTISQLRCSGVKASSRVSMALASAVRISGSGSGRGCDSKWSSNARALSKLWP